MDGCGGAVYPVYGDRGEYAIYSNIVSVSRPACLYDCYCRRMECCTSLGFRTRGGSGSERGVASVTVIYLQLCALLLAASHSNSDRR